MTDLRLNTTTVIDYMKVRLDSLKSTIPSAVVAYEIARLRNNFNVILERCNALPAETDLWFPRAAEQLVPLEQINDTGPVPALGLKRRCQPAKKSGCSSDTDLALSKDPLITDSEEELLFSC